MRIYESVHMVLNWMDVHFEWDFGKKELLCVETGNSIPMSWESFQLWKMEKRKDGWRFLLA